MAPGNRINRVNLPRVARWVSLVAASLALVALCRAGDHSIHELSGGDPYSADPSTDTPAETGEQEPRGLDGVDIAPAQDEPQVAALSEIPVTPIDLATALELIGVQNPEFLISQQRTVEAVAIQQLAAAQILPTINLGTSYDGHQGNLQQSSGNILSVNRNSLFVGAGAVAIAAGTVNIPGVVWSLNASEAVLNYMSSRQLVVERQWGSQAVRNEMTVRVVVAYLDLLEGEGTRSILLQTRREAADVARVTANFAKAGQGRKADADRAAVELRNRDAELVEAEQQVVERSSRLTQLLGLDQKLLLHPTDNWVVPHAIVPDPIALPELVAMALLTRPELSERQAAIRQAFLALQNQRLLPFSPTLLVGLSSGAEGGGSNLVSDPTGTAPFARSEPRFGNFGGRTDFDVVAVWSLRNLGVGNRAQIEAAASRLRTSDLQKMVVLDTIRAQVANAYTRSHARFAQIDASRQAADAARQAWEEDLLRTRGNEGLPIEVLDSLRLLGTSRLEYLRSIVHYNRAQFELYLALGQPPADMLVRPVPEGEVVPAPAE